MCNFKMPQDICMWLLICSWERQPAAGRQKCGKWSSSASFCGYVSSASKAALSRSVHGSKSDLFSPSINYNILWLISEELRSQFSWPVREERCLIGDIHFGHMHAEKLVFRVWCVFCSWSPLTFHLASDRSRVTLDFIIWALWKSVWNKNLRHWFWKISVNRKLAKTSKVSIGGALRLREACELLHLLIPAVHTWVEIFGAYCCRNESVVELAWTILSYLDHNAFGEITCCFISLPQTDKFFSPGGFSSTKVEGCFYLPLLPRVLVWLVLAGLFLLCFT